ncbi:MAG: endonuclease/exonuclease/phosphatase family protein [Saprospiraceae bacterium]|jgi:deoxyribonuclease-1-like protein|nr:endonuclease/exonuclease/phosphatase family protein [Saprospiraceae bacterium]
MHLIFLDRKIPLHTRYLVFFAALLFSFVGKTQPQSPEIKVISWNIRDFGQSRNDQEIEQIAGILKTADIICIQEVVAGHPGGAQAVGRLATALTRNGQNWDYRISDPTQSPNSHIRERYAFLWKSSRITIKDRPFLLKAVDAAVHREPYVGIFKAYQSEIVVINYHSRTHEDESDAEMEEISAITSQLDFYRDKNILWLGDFNLSQDHPCFDALKIKGFHPVVNGEKTTLKTNCKEGFYLSSEEDNIFYRLPLLRYKSSRVIDFMKGEDCFMLPNKRKALSDHLPLEIILSE